MNYTPSPHIDTNKVFLIKRSELEDRYDSTSYRPSFSFTSTKFRIEKLAKVAYINPKVSFDKLAKESEISFVPMEVINEFNGKISEERFKKVEESKGFTRFAENDLIWAKITPCMQNGKSAVARNLNQGVACGSTEFFVIRPKSSDELLVDYVHFFLRDERVLKDAQNYFGGSAGQQRVSSEFLRNFKIPIPPIDVQHKIVGIINNAYNAKQQKEAEAKALLESIDTYLLGELGISLPEQDNSLEKRIFITKYSEVVGKRFDSYYYTNDFYQLEGQLSNSKYRYIPLSDVVKSISNGFDFRDYKDSGTPYIKVANVKPGGFDFTKIQYIDFNSSELVKKIQLKKGNLLLTRKGTFGNALALAKDYDYIISSEVFYIELKQDIVESGYLEIFLNSYICQKQFDRIKIGAIMGSLSQEALKFMRILLPPLEKQTEIANHIQNIRSQAKTLQHEATSVLEEAKREVEKMILGE